MDFRVDDVFTTLLTRVAPGSPLRTGLDRILQSGRGALIVLSDASEVLNICSGGFLLDAAFTPQRLTELAKMDGALILSDDLSRIARANVHLVPNPNVPTSETGTRHRTAERVARSLNVPTISVSESRKEIQIYMGDHSHQLSSVSRLLERSNQGIQTLERYRSRLNAVMQNLLALEVENLATVRDVVEAVQRVEMLMRIAAELERNLLELGSDGRLVKLQMDELMVGIDDERRLLTKDYVADNSAAAVNSVFEALALVDDDVLFDDVLLAKQIGFTNGSIELSGSLVPRGFRLLSKIPRITEDVVENIVAQFGDLKRVLQLTEAELAAVDGIGPTRSRALHEGITRLAQASILDRL